MSANVNRVERVASAVTAGLLLAGSRNAHPEKTPLTRALPWVGGMLLFRALTGYCPLYGALRTGTRPTDTRDALRGPRGIHVRESIVIARRPHEIYAIWRQLENLPRFMSHLETVTELDEKRSHWVTRPVAGMRFEWDAEIINEEEGEHIGWRSLPGAADVVSAGSVHFTPAPDGAGTLVRVVLQYDPPAGRLGQLIARLFGEDPARQIREDLARVKAQLETGSPSTVDEGVAVARGHA